MCSPPIPLSRYHWAFLRSQVHRGCPSGACRKQLSYSGDFLWNKDNIAKTVTTCQKNSSLQWCVPSATPAASSKSQEGEEPLKTWVRLLSTAQAAARGSRTSKNVSEVHELTVRYFCSPDGDRSVNSESQFSRDTTSDNSFLNKVYIRKKKKKVKSRTKMSSKQAKGVLSACRQGHFKDQLPKLMLYWFMKMTFLKLCVNSNYFIHPRATLGKKKHNPWSTGNSLSIRSIHWAFTQQSTTS